MRRVLIALAAFVVGAVLVVGDAGAARLGGGRSLGAQRSIARSAPAAVPARPAQQQAAPASPGQAAPAAPAQPQSGLARWAPLLGGLAIGGLLGALFGGGGLGGVLLLALAALAVFMVIGALSRRRSVPATIQYAGMDERAAAAEPPVAASRPASGVPAGFDTATFLRGAKMNFVKLQVANDAADLDGIRELTTTEMFDALAKDLQERGGAGHPAQRTEVGSLDAELLELVSEPDSHWASVRFSGVARETPGAPAEGFAEVWNLVKPADGSSGWLLAGIQQLH